MISLIKKKVAKLNTNFADDMHVLKTNILRLINQHLVFALIL